MRSSVRLLFLAAIVAFLFFGYTLYSSPIKNWSSLGSPFHDVSSQPNTILPGHGDSPQMNDSPIIVSHTQPSGDHEQVGDNDPDNLSESPTSDVQGSNGVGAKEDKVVVVGKLASQDTTWVIDELPEWQHAIYTVDDPTAKLHTVTNKGREALPYLTYLVNNYDNLPSTIAFVHAHKDGFPDAWHNDNRDYSNVLSLQALQIPFVQANGYVNLRCNPAIGCPAEVTLNRSEIDWGRSIEVNMPGVWGELFGTKHPDIIATPCCAQFAVSRNQVRQRPLADYQKYLNWLLETKLDDELSGRMLEYLWHIIFGREPIYCPDIMTCYCEVYGWCNIDELPAPGTGRGRQRRRKL